MKVFTQFNSTFNIGNNRKMQTSPLKENAASTQVQLLRSPATDTVSFGARGKDGISTRDPDTAASEALNFLKSLGMVPPRGIFMSPSPSIKYVDSLKTRQEVLHRKDSLDYLKGLLEAYDRDAQKEAVKTLGVEFNKELLESWYQAGEKLGWNVYYGKKIDDKIMTMLEENGRNYTINKAISIAKENKDYDKTYEASLQKVMADKERLHFYLTEGSYYDGHNDTPIKDYHGWFREMMVWKQAEYFDTSKLDPAKDKEKIAEKDLHKRIFEGIKEMIIENFDNPDPDSRRGFYLYRDFRGDGKTAEWDAYIVAEKGRYRGNNRVTTLNKEFLKDEYSKILEKVSKPEQRRKIEEYREKTRFELALKKFFIEYCGRPSEGDDQVFGLPGDCILEPLKGFYRESGKYHDPYDYLNDYSGKKEISTMREKEDADAEVKRRLDLMGDDPNITKEDAWFPKIT